MVVIGEGPVDAEAVRQAMGATSDQNRDDPEPRFAVRSSAVEEDRADASFAGQYESHLGVAPHELSRYIEMVRRSGDSERLRAYRQEQGLSGEPTAPAVLIQRMVYPSAAGVAFSCDPVSGRRGVAVVSAVHGLGSLLVGGDADADTFHIDPERRVIERTIVEQTTIRRVGRGAESIEHEAPLPAEVGAKPSLSDVQAVAVAELARAAARHFGAPQDIEWAYQDGVLHLLQSRPITTLAGLPDPDGARVVWDNANIIESYPGVTAPLTFTFARHAYEGVYRKFAEIMGVPSGRIEDHADVFRGMIGSIRGRVYYHLVNWHRVLAMLPGYKANRGFMEQMMGVRDAMPDELLGSAGDPTAWARMRDRAALAKAALGLVRRHVTLERDIRRFYARLSNALSQGGEPTRLRLDELAAEYRRLERDLLTRWDAPLVNDFFAMIFFGVLGKLTQRITGEDGLHNALLAGAGGMISVEPARQVRAMAEHAAPDPALTRTLKTRPAQEGVDALSRHAALRDQYRDYLERYGERCLEELKLESPTLIDDPTPLLRSIGHTAERLRHETETPADKPVPPHDDPAQARVAEALRKRPLARLLHRWVLRHAKARVTARENLRFERTRVFGRVRRLFVEMGRRLADEGRLDNPRDVFYLQVDELLGFVEGAVPCDDLRALAGCRHAAYAGYQAAPPPPDRFETRGAVHLGPWITPPAEHDAVGLEATENSENDGATLVGTPCCTGRVTGPARVITDPAGAEVRRGEILVAERTDPGWILLFPSAAGVLVQRGSALSHSAIVARELGIPAVVSIPGLLERVRTGDMLEIDGATGRVRITPNSAPPTHTSAATPPGEPDAP